MAQFALAEDTFNRQQPLFRDSVISPIEFEQVKTQVSSAKAQLDAAEATLKQVQEQLAYTKVTAPFSGSVEAHMVELGEQVAPGMVVARLVNTSRVRVAAGIPERYAGDVRKGAEAIVDLQSYGLEPRDGKVTFVGSAIDAGNRTFPVEIELYNSKGSLKPEMIATVIVTRKTIENALVVKQSAILRDEFGSSVYVVDRSSGQPTALRRTIKIGPSNRGMVVVTDGLSEGAELITVGQSNVAPGDLLEIESVPVAQATL
jgi:membrane fusion protein (multidrug efflux system)